MTHTKNTVSDEMLPCPFCGGTATLNHAATDDFNVACFNRECFGPRGPAYAFSGDAITAWNLRASIPGGVGVKKLEWSERAKNGDTTAHSVVGEYAVGEVHGYHVAMLRTDSDQDVRIARVSGFEQAKAAAQADYEHRILSALDLSPAEGEPDYYSVSAGTMHIGLWPNKEHAQQACREIEGATITPLYAAPSNPVISDEEVARLRGIEKAARGIRPYAALDVDWVARLTFETAVAEAYGFRSRAETAEACIKTLEEALNWAMDEIDVLSNKLYGFAYPQGMQFGRRAEQLPHYESAVTARSALKDNAL